MFLSQKQKLFYLLFNYEIVIGFFIEKYTIKTGFYCAINLIVNTIIKNS